MMFENCRTNTDQGNIGLFTAIQKLGVLGYRLSLPLTQNLKYDLVIEINDELKKVQVKTTNFRSRKVSQNYMANLRTLGGNKTEQKIKKREYEDYDYLFVLCGNGDIYFIPSTEIKATNCVTLGKNYLKYKL